MQLKEARQGAACFGMGRDTGRLNGKAIGKALSRVKGQHNERSERQGSGLPSSMSPSLLMRDKAGPACRSSYSIRSTGFSLLLQLVNFSLLNSACYFSMLTSACQKYRLQLWNICYRRFCDGRQHKSQHEQSST